jgi:hypothetical protein
LISHLNQNYLSTKSVSNAQQICGTFHELCGIKIENLLKIVIARSYNTKIDYSFVRYKSLAISTHSSNSIMSTFSG